MELRVAPPAPTPANFHNESDSELISLQVPHLVCTAPAATAHDDPARVVREHVQGAPSLEFAAAAPAQSLPPASCSRASADGLFPPQAPRRAPAPRAVQPVVHKRIDDDPVLQFAVAEYARISKAVVDFMHAITEIQARVKEILGANIAEMNEVTRPTVKLAQLNVELAGESRKRNTIVARVVVHYTVVVQSTFNALLNASTADFVHIQSASHSKLARLGADMSMTRMEIASLKRDIERAVENSSNTTDAVNMNRLGAALAAEGQELQGLEVNLLSKFVQLFKFSSEIRSAAQQMAESVAGEFETSL